MIVAESAGSRTRASADVQTRDGMPYSCERRGEPNALGLGRVGSRNVERSGRRIRDGRFYVREQRIEKRDAADRQRAQGSYFRLPWISRWRIAPNFAIPRAANRCSASGARGLRIPFRSASASFLEQILVGHERRAVAGHEQPLRCPTTRRVRLRRFRIR